MQQKPIQIASKPLIEEAIRRTHEHIGQIQRGRLLPLLGPHASKLRVTELVELERRVLARLQGLLAAQETI